MAAELATSITFSPYVRGGRRSQCLRCLTNPTIPGVTKIVLVLGI
jgi:hypothetical protein